jgi:hypothetical protein
MIMIGNASDVEGGNEDDRFAGSLLGEHKGGPLLGFAALEVATGKVDAPWLLALPDRALVLDPGR